MPKRLLIVDDEPDFRFSASIVLRRAGYRVSEAGSGEEALCVVLEEGQDAFDLLLIDIHMPGMSGIELIEELKKRDVSIPVIAISGLSDKALVLDLLGKGCKKLLEKPFEPKDLIRELGTVIGG